MPDLHSNQVKRILTDSSFIVYHEDFRKEFILDRIADEEDLEPWLNMITHSNIVTLYDDFIDDFTGFRF
jgi:hypothetical protein